MDTLRPVYQDKLDRFACKRLLSVQIIQLSQLLLPNHFVFNLWKSGLYTLGLDESLCKIKQAMQLEKYKAMIFNGQRYGWYPIVDA